MQPDQEAITVSDDFPYNRIVLGASAAVRNVFKIFEKDIPRTMDVWCPERTDWERGLSLLDAIPVEMEHTRVLVRVCKGRGWYLKGFGAELALLEKGQRGHPVGSAGSSNALAGPSHVKVKVEKDVSLDVGSGSVQRNLKRKRRPSAKVRDSDDEVKIWDDNRGWQGTPKRMRACDDEVIIISD